MSPVHVVVVHIEGLRFFVFIELGTFFSFFFFLVVVLDFCGGNILLESVEI
jgi:hypothetical protein